MGKRIEDLAGLSDTPIAGRKTVTAADEREPWYQFIGTIDDLLASGEYDWAFSSLDGIRQTVESTRRVSEGQERAIKNIERSPRSRRYDGFGGR